ncbi:MAG: M55 family metallopeptidase [Candidatus Cloacimonetes bacterium]|nr:M55 family metallopeptidase [Candidatus Cloacimonadota bacterium]
MKKLFISFDYEGMGGVCNWQQVFGSQRYNELITDQINEFLRGIYQVIPAAEIVLCDSHADGNNIIYEKLTSDTLLVSGYPRHLYMMEGINAGYDGVIFLGYHAPVGQRGNMDHTYSSSSFYQIRLNGSEVSEAHINAMLAAHYGVPLLFMYSDDAGIEWMRKNLTPDLAYLESKKVISRYAAEFQPWHELLLNLYEAGKKITDYQPWLMPVPQQLTMELDLIDTNIAYALQMIPGVMKITERTISFTAKDPLEMYRYLMTCVMVSSAVKNYYR